MGGPKLGDPMKLAYSSLTPPPMSDGRSNGSSLLLHIAANGSNDVICCKEEMNSCTSASLLDSLHGEHASKAVSSNGIKSSLIDFNTNNKRPIEDSSNSNVCDYNLNLMNNRTIGPSKYADLSSSLKRRKIVVTANTSNADEDAAPVAVEKEASQAGLKKITQQKMSVISSYAAEVMLIFYNKTVI